jgi:hypothetical protein
LGEHLRFGLANRGGEGKQLPVTIGIFHTVGVHYGHFPDAAAAEMFRRVRSHAAYADDENVASA